MQTLRYHNLITDMPASLIKHQNDLFVWPCTDRVSELLERHRVGRNRYRRQQQPEGLATRRAHEAIHVHPFVAMLNPHNRPLAFAPPHAPNDRFEPNAMLVHRPLFHLGIGMRAADGLQRVRKVFFETFLALLGRLWRAVAVGHTSDSSGGARLPSHAAHGPCGRAWWPSTQRLWDQSTARHQRKGHQAVSQ